MKVYNVCMKIRILYGVPGARKAKGTVIIVDVFRAATLEAYLLQRNAVHIIPVSTVEEAFNLKRANKDYILVGEEQGISIEGFDNGNSPKEIVHADFTDKVIVHRSSQGTQGLINAKGADEIIFGSFTVTASIVKYIRARKPQDVSIVAMDGKESEDDVFAKFLKERLLGKKPDADKVIQGLRRHKASLLFLDPLYPHLPKEDLELCLKVDIFDFIPILEMGDTHPIVKKLRI